VVVVPCNTAHLLYERWAQGAPVPLPHIVQATVAAVQAAGATQVAAFTSASLRRQRLFERTLEGASLAPVDIGQSLADLVGAAIDSVKRLGHVESPLLAALAQGLRTLQREGVDGIVIGCTELASLAPLCREHGLAVAESNSALAAAAWQLITSSE
jgi:aspartate racemase